MQASTPFFSDWLSVIIVIVTLAGTWLSMIAMLRTILSNLHQQKEWQSDALGKLLEKLHQQDLANNRLMDQITTDHQVILSSMSREKDRHHQDHQAILVQLQNLIGKCELLIDRSQ